MAGIQFGVDNIVNWFRRAPRIRDEAETADFVDRQSSFAVQKCVIEYARARSGVLWSKLFKEEAFMAALERARWGGYCITLGNTCEMLDTALRPHAPDQAAALARTLTVIGHQVMSRYDVPPGHPATFWSDAREALAARLARGAMRQPRRVKDIPIESAPQLFELLPIHKDLRGHDYELVQNNLRSNLCRAYETLLQRADPAELAPRLVGAGGGRD